MRNPFHKQTRWERLIVPALALARRRGGRVAVRGAALAGAAAAAVAASAAASGARGEPS
jgi:hypothetical protein